MKLLRKIKDTITGHSMLISGDHVLLGLSGGPDSTCLAVILEKLRKDFNLSLSAVYVNHGLRPDEAEGEEAFCRSLCRQLDVMFYAHSVDVKKHVQETGMNKQEAARELRYTVFNAFMEETGASKLALGHTADDQAETVLMRLIRGTGRTGLTGIPAVRGSIIRPLIDVERAEIERYLKEEVQLSCMTDSSNLREDYFRNWIRLNIIPEIKKYNPSVIKDISSTADVLREEDGYLDIVVTKTLMRMISRKSDLSIELFLTPLAATEKPILRRVLRRALDATTGLRGISFAHIEAIMELIKTGRAGDSLNLPGGIRVVREYSLLKFNAVPPSEISDRELSPPAEVTLQEIGCTVRASFHEENDQDIDGKMQVALDGAKLAFPLTIRKRVAGDFFFPAGFGKRKKLQDYFVDEKVPRDMRDSVPIVVSGNDIVWVAGYRADERFCVKEESGKVLVLELVKAQESEDI